MADLTGLRMELGLLQTICRVHPRSEIAVGLILVSVNVWGTLKAGVFLGSWQVINDLVDERGELLSGCDR